MQCTSKISYVSLMPRMIAYFIDVIVAALIGSIISGIADIFELFGYSDIAQKGLLFQYSMIAILVYIVKKIYFVAFTSISGQTLGKMCFRIKVIQDDGSKVRFGSVLYRETIGRYLSEVVCFLGYTGILVDRKKRALHDWMSDTCVVYDDSINNEKPVSRAVYVPIKREDNREQSEQVLPEDNERQAEEKTVNIYNENVEEKLDKDILE